jgi:hypothetical protein
VYLKLTYGEVRISKHLCDNFTIQNSLKQGDVPLLQLFNFTLKYAIRKVQINQVGLKLIGIHHLLIYADDVNLLGDNIDTLRKNTETLVDASKEVEVNVEKPKYTLISHHQSAGKNHENIANRCSENVTHFKYIFAINSNKSNKFRKKLRGS